MSRRASVFARQNPGRRRVRFPDEIVFEESIKESDAEDIMCLLRRASVDIDVDRINMAGMTALHQAVLDNNLVVVKILVHHGAQIDKADTDSWTPLHAAVANGHHDIVKYLISQGASKNALTDEGERPIDLVDPNDQESLHILLAEEDKGERDRRMSLEKDAQYIGRQNRKGKKAEDLRRESFNIIRGRKGSMWNSAAVDEEEENDEMNSSSEEEMSTRHSAAGSDLRKMATSMNRSQFNSAVLGKQSDTEDSKKPVAACGSSFADRYLASEVTKRLSLLEKSSRGNSSPSSSGSASLHSSDKPTITTEKTHVTSAYNKDKHLPVSPLVRSGIEDNKTRPRSPLLESKLSSSPRPLSPLTSNSTENDKKSTYSSSKYSSNDGGRSGGIKSKLYSSSLDTKLGSSLLPDKFGGNKQLTVLKSDAKMSVKDKHVQLKEGNDRPRGGAGTAIKFSLDKSGCESFSHVANINKGTTTSYGSDNSNKSGASNTSRLTKVSALLDKHESAVKASRHAADSANSSPTSSPKLSGSTSNRVAALSKRFTDGSSSLGSSPPSSPARTYTSEPVLTNMSTTKEVLSTLSTPKDISSKRATFNLKTEMAAIKRASLSNPSTPRSALSPSASPSLAPKLGALRSSRQNAAEEFNPLEDDVNSMLENWRKKRLERRER